MVNLHLAKTKMVANFLAGIGLIFLMAGHAHSHFSYNEIRQLRSADKFECLFLGDTYYGESYQERYKNDWRPFLDLSENSGYDRATINLQRMLFDSDLNIANLEGTLTNKKVSPLIAAGKDYVHKGDIRKATQALLRHRIDVVSLANNHAVDYGIDGLRQTQALLAQNSIKYFGAGENNHKALQPYLFKVPLGDGREFKVAVIGALQERQSYGERGFNFYANTNRAGVAQLNEYNIRQLVRDLREFDKDIFIILFPHWGRDYQKVTNIQRVLADSWKEIGINAVIGQGAHIAQPIEVSDNQITLFNIGNFIFNAAGRFESMRASAYSFIVKMIKFSGSDRVVFRVYPTFGDNRLVDYSPRFVGPEEFSNVLEELEIGDVPGRILGRDSHGWYVQFNISEQLN